jgi:phosphomannomutase
MAGYVLPRIFYQVENLEILEVHFELNGDFPNHEANPIKAENYRDLELVMKVVQADLGVMFDGDADRIGFMDHTQKIIPADIMTAFLADHLLPKETRNKEVVYDIRSSRVVEEVIKKQGGVATLNKVGHVFMKETLREHDALFGGELAGHFYFRDFFYADSAIFAFIQVINILSRTPISFHELTQKYMKYYGSGEINFKVKDADKILNDIIKSSKDDEGAKINLIDGLRVDYQDYWVSIRKSNTEPLLRLVVEAITPEIMKEKTEYFKTLITSY